jgi:signal transduction histidine kinase
MQQNGAMTTAPRQPSARARLWRGVPVALAALVVLGYVVGNGIAEAQPVDASLFVPHGWAPAVLLTAQVTLLLWRYRAPAIILLAVAALDVGTLLMSSGELGTGSLAVMIAVYVVTRLRRTPSGYLVTAAAAGASIVVTALASRDSVEVPAEWIWPFAVVRGVLTFGIPVVIAEIVDGRARLIDALRERAEAAEFERERRAADAVQRERASMARELHDIAAHHLTGIIVSAQAADALVSSDPETAADYIRSVQRDARLTLDNLRQTVGLMRTDPVNALGPVPSIEQLPALVAEASTSGTPVQLEETGTPQALGQLAGIAAYRMVQESLANASSHAPGASRRVEVDYGPSTVRVTVSNGPSATRTTSQPGREGYGLLGMAERAELIGASLTTGPSADGGWQNTLTIPYDGDPS